MKLFQFRHLHKTQQALHTRGLSLTIAQNFTPGLRLPTQEGTAKGRASKLATAKM